MDAEVACKQPMDPKYNVVKGRGEETVSVKLQADHNPDGETRLLALDTFNILEDNQAHQGKRGADLV